MPTDFPGGVDDFPPAATLAAGTLDDVDGAGSKHSDWMGDVGDALEAIETFALAHDVATSSVHGIADTAALETTSGAQAKVDTHVNDTSAAHAASAIANTPAGAIAATDVQAALDELDSEKQPLDADLTAIAALSTTTFGRALLEVLDAAELLNLAGMNDPDNQPEPIATQIRQFAGIRVPFGALDRWRHAPNPLKTPVFVNDSIWQGTLGYVDGPVQRTARGLTLDIANVAVCAGAGFYSFFRSGNLLGVANTGFEWFKSGTWAQVSSLNTWDFAGFTASYLTTAPTTRRVTDGVTTANSRTVTSATANFTSADVGCPLTSNTGLPPGCFVTKINSTTSVELNQPARSSTTGRTFDIMGTCFIWTRPLSDRGGQRIAFDMVTDGTKTITSATAVFRPEDVGSWIVGQGIPSGTFVTGWNSATSVTISQTATTTDTAQFLAFGPQSQRIVSDAVTTSGSAVIESYRAGFRQNDVGRTVAGTNIPDGTTILSVESPLRATLSANASGSATGTLSVNEGGRIVSDAVTNATTTVTSATALFTVRDVGRQVTGTNIPSNCTIANVVSGTQITLSAAANGSASNGNLLIGDVTAPTVAEVVLPWVDRVTGGLGWSYSVDGGASYVQVASTGSATPILKAVTVATANPTTVILRAQNGAAQNAAASNCTLVGLMAHTVAAATAGMRIYNMSIDGYKLRSACRARFAFDANTTNASTTVTSATANFTTFDVGRLIYGDGIPPGTTIATRVSATEITLSQAATADSTTACIVPIGGAGQPNGLLTNGGSGFGGLEPDLLVVGYTNDLVDGPDPRGYVFCLQYLKDRLPNTDIVVFVPYEQGGLRLDGTQSTAAIQADYRAQTRAWCEARNVAYFDCYDAWERGANAAGYAAANAAGLMKDTLHPSQKGADDMSARIRRTLVAWS